MVYQRMVKQISYYGRVYQSTYKCNHLQIQYQIHVHAGGLFQSYLSIHTEFNFCRSGKSYEVVNPFISEMGLTTRAREHKELNGKGFFLQKKICPTETCQGLDFNCVTSAERKKQNGERASQSQKGETAIFDGRQYVRGTSLNPLRSAPSVSGCKATHYKRTQNDTNTSHKF